MKLRIALLWHHNKAITKELPPHNECWESHCHSAGDASYDMWLASLCAKKISMLVKCWSRASIYPLRAIGWKNWYAHSFDSVLHGNEVAFCAKCHSTPEDTRTSIAGGPQPWSCKVREKQKRFFQKTAYALILETIRPEPINRIRYKIYRWSENVGNYVGWGLPDTLNATSNRIHLISLACVRW